MRGASFNTQIVWDHKKLTIFGASKRGSFELEKIRTRGIPQKHIQFCDNDPSKWGKSLNGIPIVKPSIENLSKSKSILIASTYWKEILKQLASLGFFHLSSTCIDDALHTLYSSSPKIKTPVEAKTTSTSTPSKRGAACIITTISHLAQSVTCIESFKKHHPNFDIHIFLLDSPLTHSDFDNTPKTEFSIHNLYSYDWEFLSPYKIRYNIFEICCAIRPICLNYLHETEGYDKCVFLDSDLYFTSTIEKDLEHLEEHSFLLTPHFLSLPKDTHYPYNHLLTFGQFNAGFLAVNFQFKETKAFMDWLAKKLETHCYNRIRNNLFVDQKWYDNLVSTSEHYKILKDPGLNIGYWNLFERRVISENVILFQEAEYTCKFYHFSKFDMSNPLKTLMFYKNESYPELENLIRKYAHTVNQCKLEIEQRPNPFTQLPCGRAIPKEVRELFDPQDTVIG